MAMPIVTVNISGKNNIIKTVIKTPITPNSLNIIKKNSNVLIYFHSV